jgi:hypothetical protein
MLKMLEKNKGIKPIKPLKTSKNTIKVKIRKENAVIFWQNGQNVEIKMLYRS